MSAHPTELELDSFRKDESGDDGEAIARHVAGCVECRSLLIALRALAAPAAPADVPPIVEAVVREGARAAGRRAVASRRRRAAATVGGVVLAAAAALLIFWRPAPPQRPTAAPVAEARDVNGDGKVNILDAFAMARALEAGQAPRPQWDLTGDGVVDRADIDALARAAVSVGGGG